MSAPGIYPYIIEGFAIESPLFQTELPPLASSALDLEIRRCDVQTAQQLNALWHSRLPRTDTSNLIRSRNAAYFVAVHCGVFYASAIWTTPVAANRIVDGFNLLELRRFAIAPYAPKFTASRMLSRMVRAIRRDMPSVSRLISYQDLDSHAGTIYAASNWVRERETAFRSWTTTTRARSPDVATGGKIRWGYPLKHGRMPTETNK